MNEMKKQKKYRHTHKHTHRFDCNRGRKQLMTVESKAAPAANPASATTK